MKRLFAYFIFLLLLWSCGGESEDSARIPDSVKLKDIADKGADLHASVVKDLAQNVSSPIEMAALIKKIGIPFSKEHLSDPNLVDLYNTEFEKALNLGILGADLGYLNIYNKTSLILNHISARS
ncbi:MAG: hypothetical protein SNJ71_05265, partial [Bacteroidales bacterium]